MAQSREPNLNLASSGAEAYGFVHRVIQEYLAADEINQRFLTGI